MVMDPFSMISPSGSGSHDTSPRGYSDEASLSPDAQYPNAGTSAINNEARNAAPTVQAACLACRGKHLKCDGTVPCGRCRISNCECVYVASRRGYKGPRKNTAPTAGFAGGSSSSIGVGAGHKRPASSSPPPPSTSLAESCPMLLGSSVGTSSSPSSAAVQQTAAATFHPAGLDLTSEQVATPRQPPTPAPSTLNALAAGGLGGNGSGSDLLSLQLYGGSPFATPINDLPLTAVRAQAAVSPSLTIPQHQHHYRPQSLPDRCFEAFYYFFHAAHPFVLPKEHLLNIAKTTPLDHLIAAIRYIGSLYIDCESYSNNGNYGSGTSVSNNRSPGGGNATLTFLKEAIHLAFAPTRLKDGFFVQTLLLLVIGLDGSCEQERARQLLEPLEQAAVNISLNTRQYASMNGRGIPALEESWRRTWWDLYVVDGMIAGVHRQTNFIMFDVEADVGLPCEEHQYLSGNIPPPMFLQDFDDQIFSGDNREFSSFAYRVAAARNLGRFMRLPQIMLADDENISHVESWLTNWRMHLPVSKRDALSKSCKLDEMMFQAIMITNATSILLHQPHSQLDSSRTSSVQSCAPHRHVAHGDNWNTHTLHTLQSAKDISKMVTQAVSLLSHTHFFTCVVTMSSIVHLSKWGMYMIEGDGADDELRQQIRLNIGALNKLGEVWRAANTARDQVKGVAQEIYRNKKANQSNQAFWASFTQEEMISNITADENIMREFDDDVVLATTALPNTLT